MISACLLFSLAKTQLSFDVRFSEIANLTYQLDSIAGLIPHEANGRYKELWNREFIKSPEDEKFVDQWRTSRIPVDLKGEKEDETKWPILSPFHSGDPEVRMRAVGFDSTSVAEYRKRLSQFASGPQVDFLGKVLDHFQPRFHVWWQAVAEKDGSVFAQNMRTLLESPKIRAAMDQFVSFYQPTLGPKFTLPFVLMYKPTEGPKESTAGQQLEKHSLVQFLAGEKAEDRIEVVLHEVCHFLYNHGPKDRHLAFQKALIAAKRPSVVPSFNLLDEGLATVFGNGIIAQAVQTPERFERRKAVNLSWYNNPGIDQTAKTIFEWVPTYIASGKTLFDPEFRTKYLDSMEKSFGASLTAPSRYLTSLSMTIPPDFDKSLFGLAMQTFHPGGMYSNQDDLSDAGVLDNYQDLPALGTVLVMKKDKIDWLTELGIFSKEQSSALKKVLTTSTNTMIAFWGGRPAPTFVIIAEKSVEVGPWIHQIAKMTELKEGIQTLPGN